MFVVTCRTGIRRRKCCKSAFHLTVALFLAVSRAAIEILITASAVYVTLFHALTSSAHQNVTPLLLPLLYRQCYDDYEFSPGSTLRVNVVILVQHNHSFALVLTALTHRRFVTPVAALHMLPCWRSLVDLSPWKEKQRHSVHTDTYSSLSCIHTT